MVRSPPFTLPYGFGAARGVTADRHPQCDLCVSFRGFQIFSEAGFSNLKFSIPTETRREKGDAATIAAVSARLEDADRRVRQAAVFALAQMQ